MNLVRQEIKTEKGAVLSILFIKFLNIILMVKQKLFIMSFKKGLIYSVLLIGFLVFSSCDKDDDIKNDDIIDEITDCIKGEGAITTSTLSMASFTGINLAMSINVSVQQGATQIVKATGHPNIIDLVSTTVSNGIWIITFQNNHCIEDFELSFVITVPNINQLTLNGSGNIDVDDFSIQSELNLNVNGSGNLTLNDFEGITDLDINLNGSGNISGNSNISTLRTLNLKTTGSGRYSGFAISANDYIVSSLGSGDCEITAQNTLDVTISGSGNVSYKGTPTITQNITGSGNLIDAN